MKQWVSVFLAAAVLFLIPAVPAVLTAQPEEETTPPETTGESFRVLDVSSGEVRDIPARDYLIGAVLAEMPATFEPEALKAQAVAVHTYAVRQQQQEQRSPTPALYGADFSNDSAQYLACFTESQARQFYQDGYETAHAKIAAAVDAVLPYTLEYDGVPIVAAFCSMSAGKTECAEAVWGYPEPYLVAVDSAADCQAPQFEQAVTFSAQELLELLRAGYPDGDFSGAAEDWIHVEAYSDSGTALAVQVGGIASDGQTLREVLGLRSAAFTVQWSAQQCVITTRGFGHGVGMSQYGANAMAQQGSDWKEILAHYYPDTTLVVG